MGFTGAGGFTGPSTRGSFELGVVVHTIICMSRGPLFFFSLFGVFMIFFGVFKLWVVYTYLFCHHVPRLLGQQAGERSYAYSYSENINLAFFCLSECRF